MTSAESQTITHLLLIEACETRTDTVRQVLRCTELGVRLHRVGDPDEAIAYLCQTAHYRNAPRPHLVIIGSTLSLCALNGFIDELLTDDRIPRVSTILLDNESGLPAHRHVSTQHRGMRSVSMHVLADVVRQAAVAAPRQQPEGALTQ